mmetsp:Transcript_9476/g.27064  ORF Transcript_9476/g.27064 Transcript_9476/m.27064 type:complete len:404 (+) Transcript_9476:4321-5532(+)
MFLLAQLLLLHVGLAAQTVHGSLRFRQLAEATLEEGLLLHQLLALGVVDAAVHLHLCAVMSRGCPALEHALVDCHQIAHQMGALLPAHLAHRLLEAGGGQGLQAGPGPVLRPHDGAPGVQCGVGLAALAVQRVGGVHGEDDAQVAAHTGGEEVEGRSVLEAFAGHGVPQGGKDALKLLVGEQPWDLPAAQQGVDVLQEGVVKDVVVLHEQQHRLVLCACLLHDSLEVVPEGFDVVGAGEGGREELQVMDVGHQGHGAAAAHARTPAQQHAAARQAEGAVEARHPLQHLREQQQAQLLLLALKLLELAGHQLLEVVHGPLRHGGRRQLGVHALLYRGAEGRQHRVLTAGRPSPLPLQRHRVAHYAVEGRLGLLAHQSVAEDPGGLVHKAVLHLREVEGCCTCRS